MPDWDDITNEVKLTQAKSRSSVYDILRRKYLGELFNVTKRNIIIYYSAWLQRPTNDPKQSYLLSINDNDKVAFMSAVHGLDRRKGLDLILHTPGGDIAAAESLVEYLRNMFANDIRAIVPQLAMSAGTMIALSCNSIVMGKQSSLGPIDPQIDGIPAHGAIEEFRRAFEETKKDTSKIPLWQVRVAQYDRAFMGKCEKAIEWSYEVVEDWLRTGMFRDESKKNEQRLDNMISTIIRELGDHALTKSHSRHISMQKCKELGLKIEAMESDQNLQDAILTLHYIATRTLFNTNTAKLIENQNGKLYVQIIRPQYTLQNIQKK